MAPAQAMTKAELIDAIASESGLSKADAKRALDGFISTTTNALAKGERVSLVGFGSFSVSKRAARTGACDTENDVEFRPGARLGKWIDSASPILWVRASFEQPDGTVLVIGEGNTIAYQDGDDLYLRKRPGRAVSPDLDQDGIPDIAVAPRATADLDADGRPDVVPVGTVAAVLDELPPFFRRFTGGLSNPVAILARGIEKTDIRRGMVLQVERPTKDEQCLEGVGDEQLIDAIARGSKIPPDLAAVALDAIVSNITRASLIGEVVDLGGFGTLAIEWQISGQIVDPCAGTPENCPPAPDDAEPAVIWEMELNSSGAPDQAVNIVGGALLRNMRRGRNPQTGKEIKIAAKEVVKFKAGADLSSKVN